ncbi:MAG: carbohydrate kinase family protein [Spirochaetales bacterium]|uniref:Carbohydrate kinase family protein n=1 Tax=Candidatus Thalassospirochaeta sargassi TaxID=3119039 RepID=A0AAJ1IEF5_9SPIO|nr:carbohydrate kinase family protein [Spirochaetales bacterium]
MKRQEYILVIGGSNADISGIPQTKFVPGDSNPGFVNIAAGGVGRNIAENIARLDCPVKLLSAVGNDHFGNFLKHECISAGIDITALITSDKMRTSSYLCINDTEHEMIAAVSDMEIITCIGPDLIRQHSCMIAEASSVVIDNNISPETIDAVKRTGCRRILFDAVSGKKLQRSMNSIRNIDTVKLNRLEAELLSVTSISGLKEAEKASEIIAERGIHNVFITMGAEGAHYRSTCGCFNIAASTLPVRNTTGAGDAFLAGIACGQFHSLEGLELLEYGAACAALAAASVKTVPKDMNPAIIDKIINGDINGF